MNLEVIDKNFSIPSFDGYDIEWYDIRNFPFKIYGLMDSGEKFHRMPYDVAENISDGVRWLNEYTAGGRVRFKTDSPFIALSVKQPEFGIRGGMAVLGSAGFDLYCDDGANKGYVASFTPDCVNKRNERVIDFSERAWDDNVKSFTLNFPLYCVINSVYIGVKKGAVVEEGLRYKSQLPIIYYGSSITQGACASRPGNCYQNIICRQNNIDYINLGFSGSAKGEKEMAEYIKNLPMSIFVYDYDYNAPVSEHLKKTHKTFLRIIREKNPNIPVIMLSRPCLNINDYENLKRREIILETYNHFKAEGDNNIYFIDGFEMLQGDFSDECLVDYIHPNDLGFAKMATAIMNVLNNL